MKSERRHELKQNELAHGVAELWHKIEPYWQTIAGVVIVAATALFAVTFVSANQRKAAEAGWTDFLSASAARDPDALEQVAQNYQESVVAAWALHASAQARLVEASAEVHRDRDVSRKAYLAAIDGFEAVVQETTEDLLVQRAKMGLGQAYEGINELEKAKACYKYVATTWPEEAVAKRAQDRLESLEDPSIQAFYEWFFTQTPPAAKPPTEVPNLPFQQPPSSPTFTVPQPPTTGSTAPDLGDITPPDQDASSGLDLQLDPPDSSSTPVIAAPPTIEATPTDGGSPSAETTTSGDEGE